MSVKLSLPLLLRALLLETPASHLSPGSGDPVPSSSPSPCCLFSSNELLALLVHLSLYEASHTKRYKNITSPQQVLVLFLCYLPRSPWILNCVSSCGHGDLNLPSTFAFLVWSLQWPCEVKLSRWCVFHSVHKEVVVKKTNLPKD